MRHWRQAIPASQPLQSAMLNLIRPLHNATHRVRAILSLACRNTLCCRMIRQSAADILGLGMSIALPFAMKLAIPVWQERISPVFDVAGQLVLVELFDGQEVARGEQIIGETTISDRTAKLAELGVETLICGGISQPLETGLVDQGIRVIARICGNVEEVLAAFAAGRLGQQRFAMPGCCGGQQRRRMRGQRCGRGRSFDREE